MTKPLPIGFIVPFADDRVPADGPIMYPEVQWVAKGVGVQSLTPERQRSLILQAQQRTAPEGLHALVSSDTEIAPEGCLRHYPDWQKIAAPSSGPTGRSNEPGLRGFLLAGPPIRPSGLSSVK